MAVLPQAPQRQRPRPAGRASGALRRNRLTGIALTAPAMVAIAITVLFPLLWTISLSFQKFDLAVDGDAASFVGFDNYARILASPQFSTAMLQTIGYVFTTLTVELVIAIPIALLLNHATRGIRVMRLIVAIPIMIAPIVASLAFKFLFSNGYGFINAGLEAVGISAPSWFATVWMARGTVLTTNLWLALPFVILVLLAGLSNVPTELNEAAKTDGATAWQRFYWVTLPLLKPAILIVLVIRLADAFRVFDSVYVLTGGGPANSTDVMSSYLYRLMFSSTDFAGSSAATVLFVLVVGVFAASIFFLLRDRTDKA